MTQDFKYKSKLDRIEKDLNRDYKDFVPLIKKFGLREFIKLSTPTASETWSDEEIEGMGRQYYQTYCDSVARLLKLVDDARERLEGRLQEENKPADLAFLLNLWQKQQEPGRAAWWCHRHAEQVVNSPAAIRQQLEQMVENFHIMIADRNTAHMAKRRADADPEIARKRALLLFRKQDLDAIQDLLEGLGSMDQDTAKPIQQLVAGYVAELRNDPEQALSHYQEIVAQPLGSCTEEALRRILSISLGRSDSENALLALDCLASLSPVYIPQYADLLRVVGEPGQALDRYADYLEKIPDDPLVLMKVGKLYRELGMGEEALTVFRYLLEKDPQSRTYRQLITELENEQQGAEKDS
jgi:tetratricopeptide (TPR) repeat protein